MINTNKMKYDSYILFLLGADNFKISKHIRELGAEFGMDFAFAKCEYIASKFEKYDADKQKTLCQYDSFEKFLKYYEKEIFNFVDYGKEFNITEELWVAFYYNGELQCSYTLADTFGGERQATLELIASENDCKIEDIEIKIEKR